MSSPLITLGRPRRPNILHGHGKLEGSVQSGEGDEMFRDVPIAADTPRNQMLPCEPATTGKRAAPFKHVPGYIVPSLPSLNMFQQEKGSKTLGKEQSSVPSDFDLLRTTIKRMGELETRVRLQMQEIQLKDQQILHLEQKMKRVQSQKTDDSVERKHVQELERRCQELQKRVSDMECFLSDYGLVWVGDNNSSNAPKQDTNISQNNSGHTFHVDFDLILENLQDLNVLGGEGVSHIEYKERAACLRPPEPIPLTLYNNGIIMFQGPFRSYNEPSTQQCIQDIMDGYFPSELQSRFPDGVTFQVSDMRNVVFRERRPLDEFPGRGQCVGGKENILRETTDMNGPQLSIEKFLSRLPKSVVHSGRVIDIQGPIRETLQGSSEKMRPRESIVDSPHVLSMKYRSGADLSMLRIKSENGDHTYKVRMLPTETLGELREILSKHIASDLSSFDLVSTFPHRVYDNNSCTLKEAGLVPNAFLILQRKKI